MTNQMKYEQYKFFLIFTFFYSLKLFAEPNLIQAAALIIQPQYLQKYEENIVIADKKKLIEQYATYESYRPDSFSDATRNPFGPKRYKVTDLLE